MTTPEDAATSVIGGVGLFLRNFVGKIVENDMTGHGDNVFRKKNQ